jgi:hypothetical protein
MVDANDGSAEGNKDEKPIEGGEVSASPELTFQPARHRAVTARYLAYGLAITLVLSVIVQYVCTLILIKWGAKDSLDNLSKIFNAWLPVISGLVSSAATYYFTKDRN